MQQAVNAITEDYDEIMGVNSVCIGKNYLPYPTRLWTRSSTPFIFPDENVFIPYLNKDKVESSYEKETGIQIVEFYKEQK